MSTTIVDSISDRFHLLAQKNITLGFDGFVDIIYKVVKSKDEHHNVSFFNSIHDFGTYILDKAEKNFSLEIEEMITKIGGNMPIMANALAHLGCNQNCIGALGYPLVHPLFSALPINCKLYSFANPGITKALEFNGSKIMMAEMGPLNRVAWESVKEIVGVEKMVELMSSADLVCLLNWSEIDNSTSLWKGLLNDILANLPPSDRKTVGFFDLADCSKRSNESISEALNLVKSFSHYWDITLSLNMNESMIVHKVLTGTDTLDLSIEKMGANLYHHLGIGRVIIHYSREALAWDSSGFHRVESFYVSNPSISTGAGDNFNAGYCAGLLMGLSTEMSLTLGHSTSNFYMTHGKSPSIPEVLELLNEKSKISIP